MSAWAKVFGAGLLALIALMLIFDANQIWWAWCIFSIVVFTIATPLLAWGGSQRNSRGQFRSYWAIYLTLLIFGVILAYIVSTSLIEDLKRFFESPDLSGWTAFGYTFVALLFFTLFFSYFTIGEDFD